jgi:hypothetical protein
MNIPLPPLINGKAQEWSNIVISILGAPVTDVVSIEYEEKQAMENVYAIGSAPVARIYGKEEPTAKMTVLMSTIEALQAIAPLGKLQRIPEFTISVSFIDDSLTPVTHKLRNVRIMNNNRKSKTGDGAIEVELELILSHIDWD